MHPTVSVIIPAYNSAETLRGAIESALDQGVPGMEVLVADDGSTDGTAEILRKFSGETRVRVLHHADRANHGTCASRRLALAAAQGEFVAFLDADDAFLPGKLTRHLDLLRRRTDVVLVHGPVSAAAAPGLDPAPAAQAFDLGPGARAYDPTREPDFLAVNRVCNSTVVCRRTVVPAGDLPLDMVFQFEDWVLLTLAAFQGLFYYDPVPLTRYAVHPGSFTQRQFRRSGAWELAQVEYLATVLGRLPRGAMQRRAAALFIDQVTRLVDQRSAHRASATWAGRQFVSALTGALVPRYLDWSLRFSRPWRWLAGWRAASRPPKAP